MDWLKGQVSGHITLYSSLCFYFYAMVHLKRFCFSFFLSFLLSLFLACLFRLSSYQLFLFMIFVLFSLISINFIFQITTLFINVYIYREPKLVHPNTSSERCSSSGRLCHTIQAVHLHVCMGWCVE